MKKIIVTIFKAFYPLCVYYLITISIQMLFESGFSFFNPYADINQIHEFINNMALFITATGALCTLPFLAILFYNDDRKLDYDMRDKSLSTKKTAYIIAWLGAIGACIAMNNIISFTGIPMIDSNYMEVNNQIYASNIVMQIVAAVILAPIVEEFIFRILMFRRIEKAYDTRLGIIASAVAFGIFHGNITQGIYAFTLGFMFAYIYYKTNSFILCVGMHMAANFASLFIAETSIGAYIYSYLQIVILITFVGLLLMIFAVKYFKNYTIQDIGKEGN